MLAAAPRLMIMEKNTILIIEDEEPLLATLKLKLNKEGFVVEDVIDGAKALDKIKQTMPELILLDLILPNVSGEEILQQIKQDDNLKQIPVIIISNSGQPVEIKTLLASGADDYIIKADFTIDDILERIYNVLESRQGRPDVLIAEDEPFLRVVLAKKLRLKNIRVVTVLDGDAALKNILKLKPKVVVLDLLMPGLSGIEILDALKKNSDFDKKDSKILILSNYSGKEDELIIKEMTQGYYIKSDLGIDDVVEKIKELL